MASCDPPIYRAIGRMLDTYTPYWSEDVDAVEQDVMKANYDLHKDEIEDLWASYKRQVKHENWSRAGERYATYWNWLICGDEDCHFHGDDE